MNYGAYVAGNNDTITFRTEVPFTALTAGAPVKFQFGMFDDTNTYGGTGIGDTLWIGSTYNFKVEVNGFVLYQTSWTIPAGSTVGEL